MTKSCRFAAFALLFASIATPGLTQTEPAPAPSTPAAVPPAAAAPALAPQPLPPPIWTVSAAEELLRYVEGIGAEGLKPAAYAPEQLRQALAGGNPAELAVTASDMFLRLSADLSGGHVRGDDRTGWHFPDHSLDGNRQRQMLEQAARRGSVRALLDSLLPTHSQYVGLKAALARTPESDVARRELIRANMERWRWMPRDLGARHVIVNVPAFTAAIVENGQVLTRHRVVVGARRTPTPQIAARITAVTFNPWWHVPQSIVREQNGRFGAGYEVRRGSDGKLYVRQPPGPSNALGRLKIEMPNDLAIFLHDTPAQHLFRRPVRAFSHGCVRTQNVRDFAARLLESTGQWDRTAIDSAIATNETSQAALPQPIPVYIAYFTAAATNDGDIVTYADIYGRDAPVREALNRAGGSIPTDVASTSS